MLTAPTALPPAFAMLPLDDLIESPTQPRKRYDPARLADLAQSIKLQGVLQPILVRQRVLVDAGSDHARYPSADTPAQYEIIAGHRRVRAARLAGLANIPAVIRDLSDRDVLRVQLVENLQREDLDPLEEAEGYQALIAHTETTAKDIAAEIGKSYEYVIARLKLLALADAPRAALTDGRISASVAILLARLPKVIQGDALDEVTGDWRNHGGPPSARFAAEVIRNRFTRPLKAAGFDPKVIYFHPHPNEAKPIAPACAQCDKRTKAAEDLFSVDDSPDMCMDGECYAGKLAAQNREVVRQAKAAGVTVIEGDRAAKLLERGEHQLVDRGYTRASGGAAAFGYKPIVQLIKAAGEHLPPHELIVNPADGEPIKVYKTSALKAALKKAGYFDSNDRAKPGAGSGKGSASKALKRDEYPKARAARLSAERTAAVRLAIFHACRPRMSEEIATAGGLPWEETARAVAEHALEHITQESDESPLFDIYSKGNFVSGQQIIAKCTTMADVFHALWTALLAEAVEYGPFTRDSDPLYVTADRLGVDAGAIEAQAVEAFNAANPEPAPAPVPTLARVAGLHRLGRHVALHRVATPQPVDG